MANLPAAKIAHAQALVAWNGMEYDDAMKLAEEQTCAQLESQSYAGDSIAAAKVGIEKHLLGNGWEGICYKTIDQKYLTGEAQAPAGYFDGLRAEIDARKDSQAVAEGIMSILEEIHDLWVANNVEKYNRDAEKGDKRLFQHLPMPLIGVDEVAKDAMFLAPILSELGIQIGEMEQKPYGRFIPNKGFVQAYNAYSQKYLAENGLTKDNLAEKIPDLLQDYLWGQDEPKIARKIYMTERADLLAAQTVKNLGLENTQTIDDGRTM